MTLTKYEQADLDVIDAAGRTIAAMGDMDYDTGNEELNLKLRDLDGTLQHRCAVSEGRSPGESKSFRRCVKCKPRTSWTQDTGPFCPNHGFPLRPYPRPLHDCGFDWDNSKEYCQKCGKTMGMKPAEVSQEAP